MDQNFQKSEVTMRQAISDFFLWLGAWIAPPKPDSVYLPISVSSSKLVFVEGRCLGRVGDVVKVLKILCDIPHRNRGVLTFTAAATDQHYGSGPVISVAIDDQNAGHIFPSQIAQREKEFPNKHWTDGLCVSRLLSLVWDDR